MKTFTASIKSTNFKSSIKLNSNQKKDLYDFRVSWKNLLTDKRLFDLDKALNSLDSGWPVTGSTNKNNVTPSSTKITLIFAETCKKVG